MNRPLTILFALSILLNVFAVGLFSGRFLGESVFDDKHKRDPVVAEKQFGGPNNPFQLIRLASTLPDDSKRAFRDALKGNLKEMRKGQRDLRRLRNAFADQLVADDWDRAALEALLEEIDAAEQSQRAVFHGVFLNAFETLTPEQRLLLFQVAEERRMRGLGPMSRPRPHGPRQDRFDKDRWDEGDKSEPLENAE